MWVWWIACGGGEAKVDADRGPDDADADTDADTDADADADADTDADTDTDTGTPPDPCGTAAGGVTALRVSTPYGLHEARLEVDTSVAATVAVACVLDGDPDEVHLIESATAATAHAFDLAGLLAGADYTCTATTVCPAAPDRVTAALATPAPTDRVPDLEVTVDVAGRGDEYLLTNRTQGCIARSHTALVYDRHGRPRFRYDIPLAVGPSIEFRHLGGTELSWGGGWLPHVQGRPRIIDLFQGEIYDSGPGFTDLADSVFHHDGYVMPDGRVLTLEQERVRTGGVPFDGFRVRRLDPATNTVDFDYSSQRAYDEGHLEGGWGDVWHANAVQIAEVNGQEVLYVSLCFAQQIVAIDVPSGDWRWAFGRGGDFDVVDPSGAPVTRDAFPRCQHGPETDGTTFLVYDNGEGRDFSRVTEYTIDEANRTATLNWAWTEPDWYETTMGDVEYLPSGHVLVSMAHGECFSSNRGDRSTFVEIDPATGDKLWDARYPDRDDLAYRGDWADACGLFANAKYCDSVRTRLAELSLP
jgi:hypothetical protein